MPIPLLPALPWIGKALIGTLGIGYGVKSAVDNRDSYNFDFVDNIKKNVTTASLPLVLPYYAYKARKSRPAVATYEPDNHTNLLITKPTSPYIDEEAASISSLTRTNNWDDSYWSRPSSSWDTDVNYVTGGTPAPAPKGNDNNNNNNNNNNKNNNKNGFPWGTASILGLGAYTGWQVYQGHKDAQEQKENEEIVKKNEQSAAQLGVTAGTPVEKRNKVNNDTITGNASTNNTTAGGSKGSVKSNAKNGSTSTSTYSNKKFNVDSAYSKKNYADDNIW